MERRQMEISAVKLGEQETFTGHQVMYRLAEPLPDVGPDRRNIVVVTPHEGAPWITLARAYETAIDGVWKPVPKQQGSWIAHFGTLPSAALEYAKTCIVTCGATP
jgi:hypothetical protein